MTFYRESAYMGYLRETVASRVLLKHRQFMKMDGPDAGGLLATLLMYENMDEIKLPNGVPVSVAMKDVHIYMIERWPDLTEILPSPETVTRRLREKKEDMEKKKQIQPVVAPVSDAILLRQHKL